MSVIFLWRLKLLVKISENSKRKFNYSRPRRDRTNPNEPAWLHGSFRSRFIRRIFPAFILATGGVLFGIFGDTDPAMWNVGRTGNVAAANTSRTTVLTGRVRVVDGDSLVMRGIRIRLIGLDAPELSQSCRNSNRAYACGRKSKQFLQSMIAGRQVRCQSEAKDRYQRLLARCHVNGRDINATMVSAGWAIGYYGGHKIEENRARIARRGLWQGDFEPPHKYRWRKRG